MALPKIDVPIYTIHLPLTNKDYKFRPFLVKEEKLLLMALEGDDEKGAISTIKQVVNNCCLDQIDVDDLPIVDLEYFFLNLRARSVGEEVELAYQCKNKIKYKNEDNEEKEKECGNIVKMNVKLLDIHPEISEGHTNKVILSDTIGVLFKYPSFKMIDIQNEDKPNIEQTLDLIINCIDYIYDQDSIYYAKDVSREELIEFIESLTKQQFNNIENFFNNIPKIKVHLDFTCKKCGYHEEIELEGIQSFLA